MKDPKNQDKTTDEVKQIVAKNLGNDWEYYTTKAQFGVKGIGYQTEAPALGEPKAPKGKYKSSGYGDIPKKTVKESKTNESYSSSNDFGGAGLIVIGKTKKDNDLIDQAIEESGFYGIYNPSENNWFFPESEETIDRLENELETIFIKKGINARFKGQYNESLNEAKRPNLASELKEIEKSNEALALEAKIQKVEEAIEKRQAKLKIAESEELAEMIDPSMVKTLHKEIKELEKYKAKAQKMYEKMTKTKSKEVIDEKLDDNEAVKSYENGI
jgi:hypothetical protein